jgi:uncharacterized protein
MAIGSLLALLDDIATILDDVAVLTKVAAKKTAGVLGDDLALNAQQVAGVRAQRELPVVWAVAKGSAKNKLILVPAALALSVFWPAAVPWLLMLGGAYLCFEGVEKLAQRWLHPAAEMQGHRQALKTTLMNPEGDLLALEREKIAGAIRTDFVLSAEIITIALGSVASQPLPTQAAVLVCVAALMTVGVYGLVAGIVKLDDAGSALSQRPNRAVQRLGLGLLAVAPWLMKALSVVGTAAMFLVGGGILVHGWPALHHAIQGLLQMFADAWIQGLATLVLEGLSGVVVGTLAVAGHFGYQRLKGKPRA